MKLAGKREGAGWAATTWVKGYNNGKWARRMQGEVKITKELAVMDIIDRWGPSMTLLEAHEALRSGTYQPTPNIKIEVDVVQGAA